MLHEDFGDQHEVCQDNARNDRKQRNVTKQNSIEYNIKEIFPARHARGTNQGENRKHRQGQIRKTGKAAV
jgi:hypothetical protein